MRGSNSGYILALDVLLAKLDSFLLFFVSGGSWKPWRAGEGGVNWCQWRPCKKKQKNHTLIKTHKQELHTLFTTLVAVNHPPFPSVEFFPLGDGSFFARAFVHPYFTLRGSTPSRRSKQRQIWLLPQSAAHPSFLKLPFSHSQRSLLLRTLTLSPLTQFFSPPARAKASVWVS